MITHFVLGRFQWLGEILDKDGSVASKDLEEMSSEAVTLIIFATIIFVVLTIISIVFFKSIRNSIKVDKTFIKQRGIKAEIAAISGIDILLLVAFVWTLCILLPRATMKKETTVPSRTPEELLDKANEAAYDHDVVIAYFGKDGYNNNYHIYTYDISDGIMYDADTNEVISDKASVLSERDKLVVFFGEYPQTAITYDEKAKLLKAEWDDKDRCVIDGKRYKRALLEDSVSSYAYFHVEPIPWLFVEPWPDFETNEESYDDILISYFQLDIQRFHKMDISELPLEDYDIEIDWEPYSNLDVEWKDCSLREWLNNDFYNEAFSEMEQQLVVPVKNKNYSFLTTTINGKNGRGRETVFYKGSQRLSDTVDNVFLLSGEEFLDEEKNITRSKINDRLLETEGTYYAGHMYKLNNTYDSGENMFGMATRSKIVFPIHTENKVFCKKYFNVLILQYRGVGRRFIFETVGVCPAIRLKLFS
ncbi:MAG: hypothetical protein IK014_00395 [Lachnospiraceae bacterium]|nr:hypothetical protein [Lachnospiraceae bacterium]